MTSLNDANGMLTKSLSTFGLCVTLARFAPLRLMEVGRLGATHAIGNIAASEFESRKAAKNAKVTQRLGLPLVTIDDSDGCERLASCHEANS